jgi:non-specific protein-tyrosine kinase
METQNSANDDLDLRAVLRPVYSRWWLIILIVAAATAAAYFLDSRKAKVYQATTSVFVDIGANPAAAFSSSSQQALSLSSGSQNQISDLARLMSSNAVTAEVKRLLQSPLPPAMLGSRVKIVPDTTADFVDINATGPTGQSAASLANAYARAIVDQGKRQTAQQLSQLSVAAADQLQALPKTGTGVGQQRQQLATQLQALKRASANPATNEQQINPAAVPGLPVSPRPKRVAEFAFALSLVAAILMCFLLERLDRRIKDVDELVAAYRLPLLATLPHETTPSPMVDGKPSIPASTIEAVRMLRISIGLQALDKPVRILLVTSAVPQEGKSTTARNLALAYREAGVNVAVVDADLRSGSLSKAFHVRSASGGLTGVLLGDSTVRDARVAAPVALPLDVARNGAGESSGESEIAVLPSGGRAPNPPAILGSSRMAEVLQNLAEDHELLIIDSAPLLPVGDTLPLLSMVDGVILVGRVKHTRREQIRRVHDALARVPRLRVIGVVANDISSGGADAVYGYGYEDKPYTVPPPTAPDVPVPSS